MVLVEEVGRIQVDDSRLVIGLVDSNQLVSQIEHVVSQRYYDELSVSGSLLYVVSHYCYVLEVKSCVDLVHEVQRSGFVVVQGEYQRKRAQGLLSARQLVHLLPTFFGGTDAEVDSITEGIESVNELQLGISSACQVLINFLKLRVDDSEALPEEA